MSMLSIASRTALEAEREDGERKMASFLPQIWDLRNNLPQNTPQIGLLCYTISSAVRRAVSPIEGLKQGLSRESQEPLHLVRRAESPIEGLCAF